MIYVPSRVKRHKSKFTIVTGLNLVSLMDVFTILLFFLLIHVTGEAEVIQIPEVVSLPLSTSIAQPKPAITVYLTTKEILVGDKKIADIRDVLNRGEDSIESLEKELLYQAEKEKAAEKFRGRVIIMGDKTIPFTLLKRVMRSCSKAGYPDVTLAVIQK